MYELIYSSDIFEKISLFTQLSDVMEELEIRLENGTRFNVSSAAIISSKFYPYYPGIRAQIDISKYIEENTPHTVYFWFKKTHNYAIELELDDGSWDTVRPLYKRRMRQKGTNIFLLNNEMKLVKKYFTTISQTVHEEEDKTNNCNNYPNEDFDSYRDCDVVFTRHAYQSLYHQNNCGRGKNISTKDMVPIFTTNSFDEVTKVVEADCPVWFGSFLMIGTELSSCHTHCTTTFTDTMQTSTEQYPLGTGILISFDSSILVTRIKVDNFQLMESLNFLGSNLGLWPGLGIFQLLQWLFKNISWGVFFEKCLSR